MLPVEEVIIIGSGPAGYTAGLYTGRAMLKPKMFAGFASGGQLMLTSDVENFPGYPNGIGGPEMMMELRSQASKFGCDIIDKNVDSIDANSLPFKVNVGKEQFLTKSIIITTGAEAIWLDAKNEHNLLLSFSAKVEAVRHKNYKLISEPIFEDWHQRSLFS